MPKNTPCRDNLCLKAIPVDKVLSESLKILEKIK
jgi:hypothetical protein